MRVGSLFSGIGGLDLGLERAGMNVVWQSEIDPYASAVLRKHWPSVPNLGDIRGIVAAAAEFRRQRVPAESGGDGEGEEGRRHGESSGASVDLICGGFPCQPFSVAGKRGGKEDDRYLWPEMLRVIKEFQPRWVLGENVPGLINMALDEVLSDLESLGYETGTVVVPACALDAPHRRDRVWILGHATGGGLRCREAQRGSGQPVQPSEDVADTKHRGPQERRPSGDGEDGDARDENLRPTTPELRGGDLGSWLTEPLLGRVAHGIPNRVDRLKCLGNGVVPQVAEAIGRLILEADQVT